LADNRRFRILKTVENFSIGFKEWRGMFWSASANMDFTHIGCCGQNVNG